MDEDFLGNPITTDGAHSAGLIDDFVGGLLSYETRAVNLLAVADEAVDLPLVQTYAGMLWMFLESTEGPGRATPYVGRALAAARHGTRRERLNAAMLEAWWRDDIPGALALGDQIAEEFPRDLAAVKVHQYLNFNRGQSPDMVRIGLKVLPRAGDVAYLHGMLAFGYEQCHLLDEAEAAARRAITLKRKEPWAHHALAHVMLTRGEIDQGAAFLRGVHDSWTDLNSFMSTHLWWHYALFLLSQGREAEALATYDARVWGVDKGYSQDQAGAVQLLSRLELAGVEVGDRWIDLADHLAARATDTAQPFLALLYLMGLARAGRAQADTLLAAIRVQADTAPDHSRETWTDVAIPAAEGLMAYYRGDGRTAVRRLGPVLPRLVEIGGSHAQRDLFEQVVLDAYLKDRRWTPAQQMLELRRGHDPDGVPVNRALAQVYDALGLPSLAQQAAARARGTAEAHRHDTPLFSV
ncbi:tetratricopeptide repeat protein [Nitrospirillum sp. BR 11752]|uniref:tetratricopeptide repeat protein n=1 Tax=Nitrospirillum sp. BR 11752 TaxID=3104293 RepID=UPI002E9BA9E2|nr:tetratricopeptide repeat protein [Nitrospirillum sp. BR 11752]